MEKISKNIATMAMLLLFGATASAQSPSSTQNYVMETLVKHQGHKTAGSLSGLPVDSANRTVSYFDGLGRPLQTVQWQGSPDKKDIVTYNVYDVLGREATKYLPYAEQTSSDGSYKTAAATNQASFYGSGSWDANIVRTTNPYSRTVFEASPLNRVLEQGAPGAAWQPYSGGISGSGHTVRVDNVFNGTGEVALWTVGSSGASTSGSYAPSTLYKTVAKDENWTSGKAGTTAEFKDLQGRIVLKRQWSSNTDSLSTFYVYDDYGNLRYVVPPAVSVSFTESDASFNNYVYAYHYDGRNRVIEKKIPGKGWEHLVYNKLDQIVLTQDSVMRSKATAEWLFTKYDALGRPIMTGMMATGGSRADEQTIFDAEAGVHPLYESRVAGSDYTDLAYPRSYSYQLTVNYYDNYQFPANSALFDFVPFGVHSSASIMTNGLPTANLVRNLGDGYMLHSVTYYDDKGLVIQQHNEHHIAGTDRIDNEYSFAGELVSSVRTHTAGAATTTIANSYAYDHVGRKLSTKENINSQGDVWLNRLEYNGIGQLKQKNLHSTNGSTYLQSTKYSYNERGWMKGRTSAEFSMKLGYDTLSNPQYNGNISAQLWGSGSSFPNRFDYSYDRLNRLTTAASTGISMYEAVTYDVMGNIGSLKRDTGPANAYYYNGNQLHSIDYVAYAYAYDGNGNAVTDGRLQANLTYNHLNLPATVAKTGLNLAYTYDATGKKLKKVNSISSTTTDYVDGIQYTNGSIEFIQTEEGRALNSSGTYSYEYNLKDHLGNVRFSFKENPSTHALDPIQQDDYYAFGLRKVASAGTNNYLYNSKELQDELGQYDYGARFYDPVVGRFTTIDPMANMYQSWSSYAYVMNNPLRYADPTGMVSTHTDEEGNVVAVYEDGDKGVYKHDGNRKETTKELKKNYSKNNTSGGGQKMGETEFIDEFVSPETGKALTDTKIQFGKSFDPIIEKMHAKSKDMDLMEIAKESRPDGLFDIKKDYANVGGLLNGKYATSRSAGNFLAGYNAEGGTYLFFGISHDTFQKLAGALHIESSRGKELTRTQMVDIVAVGSYKSSAYNEFVAPTYGEVNYQYRMSLSGWNYGKKN